MLSLKPFLLRAFIASDGAAIEQHFGLRLQSITLSADITIGADGRPCLFGRGIIRDSTIFCTMV
jgi:hypothetical protein